MPSKLTRTELIWKVLKGIGKFISNHFVKFLILVVVGVMAFAGFHIKTKWFEFRQEGIYKAAESIRKTK